jgi:DNA-binding transcriptional ArsR family regulator
MLAALGHEVRLAIVRLLLARPEGLVVGEIQKEIPIPSSTLSHHLDILLRAGLVEQRREGRFLRYRGSEEGFRALVSFLSEGAAPTAPRRRSAFGD